VWLEKQAVGRHDDGYDAEPPAAAARDKDELASYDQTSAVDIGNHEYHIHITFHYNIIHKQITLYIQLSA